MSPAPPDCIVVGPIHPELRKQVQELAAVHTQGDESRMCLELIWKTVDPVGYNASKMTDEV